MMTAGVITKGETEEIVVPVVDKKGQPLAGLSDMKVRAVRLSNGHILDWTAWSFVAAPATPDVALTAVSNLTGHYERAGGFQSGLIANLAEREDVIFEFSQSPGTNARFQTSLELQVRPDGFESGLVHVDTALGSAAGIGTAVDPVNSITAAQARLVSRNLRGIKLESFAGPLFAALANTEVIGRNESFQTLIVNAQDLSGSHFRGVNLVGPQGGANGFNATECLLSGAGGPMATIRRCRLSGTLTPTGGWFQSCFATGTSDVTLDLTGIAASAVLVMAGFDGHKLKITNLTQATATVSVQNGSCDVEIDSSCTAGTINVNGLNGNVTDGSGVGCSVVFSTVGTEVDTELSASHGAGSWEGDTANAVADAVWDEDLADHLSAGSTGEALAVCAVGQVGSSQVTITIEDQLSNPLTGVYVNIYNAANTNFLTRGLTDSSGQIVFALDDGTYNVRLFKALYSFTVPETLTVSGDGGVTYQGTAQVTIVVPPSPNHCVVYGYVDNAGGMLIAGACVEAFAETPQSVGGFQKSEIVASTLSEADGSFQIPLIRTTAVRFVITDPEGNIVIDEFKTVPDAADQDLESWA